MAQKRTKRARPESINLTGDMMMILAAARLVKDGETVLAASKWARLIYEMAIKTHAPNARLIEENGTIISKNEVIYTSTADIMSLLQNGKIDVAIVGAEQIDMHGNMNGTQIGKYKKPWKRLSGWSCANDALTLAKRVIYVVPNRKEILSKCAFITGPGYLKGRKARLKEGLRGGPSHIVTDMCILNFDNRRRRAQIAELNAGITVDDFQKNCSWKVIVPKKINIIDPPDKMEMKALGLEKQFGGTK